MSFDGGYGVTFNIGNAAMSGTPSYTAIAQVKNFNGFEMSQVMSEVTHHASTGGFREKVPSGLFEVGNIELELAFDIAQATHANADGGLIYAMLQKEVLAYQIVLQDSGSTTFTFDAYVQTFNWQSPIDEHLMATVTLEVTGQPTIT